MSRTHNFNFPLLLLTLYILLIDALYISVVLLFTVFLPEGIELSFNGWIIALSVIVTIVVILGNWYLVNEFRSRRPVVVLSIQVEPPTEPIPVQTTVPALPTSAPLPSHKDDNLPDGLTLVKIVFGLIIAFWLISRIKRRSK